MNQTETLNENKLVITRQYKASPAQLFRAWTDGQLIAKWFKPNERWVRVDVNVRPQKDGKFSIEMEHQDGSVYTTTGTYGDVIPDEKVCFTWQTVGDDLPKEGESCVTVLIKPSGEGSELTLIHEQISTGEIKEAMLKGWTGCLNNLQRILEELHSEKGAN